MERHGYSDGRPGAVHVTGPGPITLRCAGVAALVALAALVPASAAQARYRSGYYSGRTSQGLAITFTASGGRVHGLFARIVDRCRPSGSVRFRLFPRAARIDRRGRWYRRAAAIPSQPTIYRGRLRGSRASGTIDDTTIHAGRRCHGHVTFRASRRGSAPPRSGPSLRIISAVASGTVGLEVRVAVRGAATLDGLLVYATNRSCASSYPAAKAQIRAEGNRGFVSDMLARASVPAGTGTAVVSSNTFRRGSYRTACAMLYYGNQGRAPNPVRATAGAPID